MAEEIEWAERRFKGDLVAAALIRRPSGEIFLVSRAGQWTIPTGHLDSKKEQRLAQTLIREMGEEVFPDSSKEREREEEILIIGILGVVTREAKDVNGRKSDAKIITIYLCEVEEETAKVMSYREKGENDFFWVKPLFSLLEKETIIGGKSLDPLVKEALEYYFEEYPEKVSGRLVKVGQWFAEKLKIIFQSLP